MTQALRRCRRTTYNKQPIYTPLETESIHMSKNVSVNLFDVTTQKAKTPKLSDTIKLFEAMTIRSRWRDDLRLDTILYRPADAVLTKDSFELNFVKKRHLGPGKVSPQQQVADIGLQNTEAFGEETTALYIPAKKWLVVLHNQYGVGPSRIAEYFNAVDPASEPLDYEIRPKIDLDTLRRLQAMKNISAVEVVASVGAFDNDGSALGKSVQSTVKAAKAARLHLRLDANEPYKKGATLAVQTMKNTISNLLKDTDNIRKITVQGPDPADVNAKDQIINLLAHKIQSKYPDRELLISNHRYTFASKIDLLRRAGRGWIDTGIS